MKSSRLFDGDAPRQGDPFYQRIWRAVRAPEDAVEASLGRHAEVLERWWKTYEPYADAGFRSGFAQDPEARIWEMRLGTALLEKGAPLIPATGRQAKKRGGPDIAVRLGDRTLWIEAVTPGLGGRWEEHGFSHSTEPIPEDAPAWSLATGAGFLNPEEVILRHLSALRDKFSSFERYRRSGICAAQDACVIAVSDGRLATVARDDAFPLIARALLPMGPLEVVFDRADGELRETRSRSNIVPKGDAEVPRGVFLDGAWSGISGVVHARMGFALDGWDSCPLHFFANPLADVPAPQVPELFDRVWETRLRQDGAFRLRARDV